MSTGEGVFHLRLQTTSLRRLQNVLKRQDICLSHTSSEDVFKTSWRRLEQAQCIRLGHTSLRRLAKTSSRRCQEVERFEDIFKTPCQDVLKTSSKLLVKMSSKHLQDIFKMYHEVKLFLLTHLQDVFQMYSACSWDVLRRRLSTKRLPRSHFWETCGQGTKFPRVKSMNITKLLKQFV